MSHTDEYTNEEIYQHFFEEYDSRLKERLDNFLKEAVLKEELINIIDFDNKEMFKHAYFKTQDMVEMILSNLVVPCMPETEWLHIMNVVRYLLCTGEEKSGELLLNIFMEWSDYCSYEYDDMDEENIYVRDDVCFMISRICRLYELLSERYGEKDKQNITRDKIKKIEKFSFM